MLLLELCSRRNWPRRGAVMVQVAMFLIPILGILALTLDCGNLLSERRRAQSTADAAALAAADELFRSYVKNKGLDLDGKARQAALASAAANGYANDGIASTVSVNIPPSAGLFAGKLGYSEVIATHQEPRYFAKIWGAGTETVNARSVAVGQWAGQNIGILVLDPTANASLNGTGTGQVSTNAKVVVDSNNPTAAVTSGGGTLLSPEFDISGGYSGGGFVGRIYTGMEPTPDPLRYIPVPDPRTMTLQNTGKLQITGSQILQPGVYRGGISISGQGSATLLPGIYYIEGGGFSFTGQGNLMAQGVMIYNAPENSNDIVSITGSGKGTVYVTPPATGIYQGISLFQDRNARTSMNIGGSGNFTILGTFYAASALLKISGSGPANTIGSQYISYDLNLAGNGNIDIRWDADLVARFRTITLVE